MIEQSISTLKGQRAKPQAHRAVQVSGVRVATSLRYLEGVQVGWLVAQHVH